MIVPIGDILIDKISSLNFVDKIAGIVKILSYKDKGVTKTFPASVKLTFEECEAGRYMDLAPDSSKKSVIFLEDRGTRFIKREGKRLYFRSSVSLICWLNMPKIGYQGASFSALAVGAIIGKFPDMAFNSGIFNMVFIQPQGQDPKTVNPFQRYSFDETVNQFLMYPYDYFSMPIDIEFMITKDCLNQLEDLTPDVCKNI